MKITVGYITNWQYEKKKFMFQLIDCFERGGAVFYSSVMIFFFLLNTHTEPFLLIDSVFEYGFQTNFIICVQFRKFKSINFLFK